MLLLSGPTHAAELYWGAVHEHSILSRDTYDATADQVYARMVDAGLDFGSVTDYDWMLYGGTWGEAIDAANAAHCPGCAQPFVSILGLEWNNNSYPDDADPDRPEYGHRNVYLLPDDPDGDYPADLALPVSGSDWLGGEPGWSDWAHPCDLWAQLDALQGASGFTAPHHPALSVSGHEAVAELGRDKPTATDWSIHPADCGLDDALEPLVEVYSVWGSSERAGMGLEEDPIDGLADDDRVVREIALGGGHRLGLIAAGDSHHGYPGLDPHHDHELDPAGEFRNYTFECAAAADCTLRFGRTGLVGVYTDGPLSRESVFGALAARRTVATTGERYGLEVTLLADGAVAGHQGSEVVLGGDSSAAPADLSLEIAVDLDGDPLGRVEVLALGDGGVWVSQEVEPGDVPLIAGGERVEWLPEGELTLYVRLEAAPRGAIHVPEGAAPLPIATEDARYEIALPAGDYTAEQILAAVELGDLVLDYADQSFLLGGAAMRVDGDSGPEIAYALGFRGDQPTPPDGWCDPCTATVPVDGGEVIERAWASPIWIALDESEPAARRCGCASAGGAGGWIWALAVLGWRRRSERSFVFSKTCVFPFDR